MIKELLLKIVLSKAYDVLSEKLKQSIYSPKLVFRKEDLITSLATHLKYIEQFSSSVKIRDMYSPKSLKDIHIDLDVRLAPRKLSPLKSRIKTTSLEQVFSQGFHAVILGDPGAGKTTSSKKLCQLLLHEEVVELDKFNFPLLIRLRDLKPRENIFKRLSSILSIDLRFEVSDEEQKELSEIDHLNKYITSYLEELKVILILDGFDEIPNKKKAEILSEIEYLVLNLDATKVLLTSRSGAFNSSLENTVVYELCPLSKAQVDLFINKWIGSKRKANKFKKQLEESPFSDTSIKPLNIAYLCALFDKYERIPEQPKVVYKKIIRLLLEDWDHQNSVKRDTRYTNLDIEERYEFFSHLSFELSSNYVEKVYDEQQLKKCYKAIYKRFNLSFREMSQVIEELESHHGIFIKSSYDTYEFDHKSIQEFFTAEFIVKSATLPINLNFSNEYAVATSLSSEPNTFLIKLLLELIDLDILKRDFLEQLLLRVIQEKIKFNTDPLLLASIFLSYSRLYVEYVPQLNLFRCSEEFAKARGEQNNIGGIFEELMKFDFYKESLLNSGRYFHRRKTNSPDVEMLVSSDLFIENLKDKRLSKYSDLFSEPIKVNLKYL